MRKLREVLRLKVLGCSHGQGSPELRDSPQYRAGEKLFVDWAGVTVPVVDPGSGRRFDRNMDRATRRMPVPVGQ